MAIRKVSGSKFTIAGPDTFILGDVSEGVVGTIHVHIVSAAFNGSVTVQARSRQQAADEDGVAFVPVNYSNSYVNGAIGTEAYTNAAITGTSEFFIPAAGRTIALDCGTYTSGSLTVYVTPIIGAAA